MNEQHDADYEQECFQRYSDTLIAFRVAEIKLNQARSRFQAAQIEYRKVQAERRLGREC